MTQRIETRSDKCGGKPVITGTRIRVWDVYILHERKGLSADAILSAYPDLELADVYAALAYYYDHKQEIDAQMKADDAFIDELKRSSGPGPLAQKLAGIDTGSDSVSS